MISEIKQRLINLKISKENVKNILELVRMAKKDKEILGVFLFGSYAKNYARENSDIDICLIPYKEKPFFKLKDYFIKANEHIDLHEFWHLPIDIRDSVLREGVLLYVRKELDFYDLFLKTSRTYRDMEHFLNLQKEVLRYVYEANKKQNRAYNK